MFHEKAGGKGGGQGSLWNKPMRDHEAAICPDTFIFQYHREISKIDDLTTKIDADFSK